jgi:hypothetical protein
MSLSRWKLMAGVLGVSLGGLAAVAGPCPKTEVKKSVSRQSEPPIPLEVPVIPALPSGGAPDLKLPAPASPEAPAMPPALPAPPAAELPVLPPPATIPTPAAAPAKPDKPVAKPAENAGSKPQLLPAPAPNPVVPVSNAESKPLLPMVDSEPTKPAIPTTPPELPASKPMPPVVSSAPAVATPPAAAAATVAAPTSIPADPVLEARPVAKPEPRPQPQPEIKPAVAVGTAKYRILLRVGEGEPTFEVKTGDDLVLRVVCERIDIKSPENGHGLSAVKAAGKVRFVGFGAEGTCEELSFLAGTGEVSLSGAVRIQVKDKLGRIESELSTDTMKYRIDPSAVLTGGKP